MKNCKMIRRDNLMLRLSETDRETLFRILSEKAAALPEVLSAELTAKNIFDALCAREEQSSTALGAGVIFPHARFAGIRQQSIVIATLQEPLNYAAPDDVPIRIACLLLIPEAHPMMGLKFISAFAKCLRDAAFTTDLLSAADADAALEVLRRIEIDDDEPLRASDIMAPFRCNATPEMPLKDATRMMSKFNAETIPVLNGRKLAGQLSCKELFKLGIPDFFSQLKSVGFIRFFDPFEKYFAVEAGSLVKDVMSKNYVTFPPDATLIEIVFAISVQHHSQVYIVTPDGELLGVIDQALLLERIINL